MILTINEKDLRLRNIYEKNIRVQLKKFKIIILPQKGECFFHPISDVCNRQAGISAKALVGELWKCTVLQDALTGPPAPEMRALRCCGKVGLIS